MSIRHLQRECNPRRPDFCRRAFGLGFLLLAPSIFSGCFPGPPPPEPPKPREGVTVRIAAPNEDAVRQLLRRHGNAWADLSGAAVEIIGPGADSDLVVFAPADLPSMIATGKVAPLPAVFSESGAATDMGYFLRPYRARLMDWQARKYAVPLFGDSLLFAWRADLLDDPQHKKAIEARLKHALSPSGPATWQEVEAIAVFFHEANGRPSLPPLPDSAEALDREFHAVAAPFANQGVSEELINGRSADERRALLYNYHFDIDSGKPLIDSPGFVEALALLQRIQKCRPPGRAPHPAKALADGTAVAGLVTLADITSLVQFERASKGVRFGLSAVPGSDTCHFMGRETKIPGGNFVPYLGSGGWMAAITPASSAADAAQEFLAYLVSPAVSLEIVYEPAWGAGPTRTTHLELNNRAGWYNYGLSVERTNQLVAALDKSINPPIVNPAFRLRVSDQALYLRAEAEAIGKELEGKTEPEKALKELAERWDAIGGPEGKPKRMREYKQSLGGQ